MLLDQLLDHLAVDVQPFAMCEVGGTDALELDRTDAVTLHYVLRGAGTLRLRDGSEVRLQPQTIVVVPAGRSQAILADPEAVSGSRGVGVSGLEHHQVGGDGERSLLLACGRLHLAYGTGIDVFRHLDDALVVDFAGSARIARVFESLLAESSDGGRPGARRMLAALMNEALVDMFRVLCEGPECDLPWLKALEDPRLASALRAMLDDPAANHTLSALADTATMSRSAFADAFHASFGQTPMAFLRDVRLRRAAGLLRTSDLSIPAVGRRVGFASRSHFTQLFTDRFGISPSRYRGTT